MPLTCIGIEVKRSKVRIWVKMAAGRGLHVSMTAHLSS